MDAYFKTRDLSVGYHKKILIHDINVEIEKGKILTLIGPNGAGKSTILKSIIRNLEIISGDVLLDGQNTGTLTAKEMAKKVAVVLTERIRPELMTCEEVVAMGRYPYTNMLGHLTAQDRREIQKALQQVHGEDLRDQEFLTASDGQKQRILLARAICQQPEVIVLDEPTAYLDIRHKIEFLDILRKMAQEQKITVIMSLHEVDLAAKVSDYVMCVKGDTIAAFGPPETVLQPGTIETLYDMKLGSYNLLSGSVELNPPAGVPKVFVVAGNGKGAAVFRALQKKGIPFAAGVLFENDVDCQIARSLGSRVFVNPAFQKIQEEILQQAMDCLLSCSYVIDAGTEIREWNQENAQLLEAAERQKIPVVRPDWVTEQTGSI